MRILERKQKNDGLGSISIAILIWAELSYELGQVVFIRDFPGPSCPGPSCLRAELSVIHPMNLLGFVIAFKSTVKSKNKIPRMRVWMGYND